MQNNKVLVTGSSGHLGEALARTIQDQLVTVDITPSAYTSHVGSITDSAFVRSCMQGVKTVYHTATLHKPHVATHSLQDFIDTNITGTLNLLQEAVAAGVEQFIFTSTTSVFGDALVPPAGQPAAWITEEVVPVPKNIYGVTKAAAEDLCQLFNRNFGLPCLVLRTSRFFPEADDNKGMRDAFEDDNLKMNEYLFRRVDLEDVVSAHLQASKRAKQIGFGKYIVSATTPFKKADLAGLRVNAPEVLSRYFPGYEAAYGTRNWRLHASIDRVYVNEKARTELGWEPRYNFQHLLERLISGQDLKSPLVREVGMKGYHTGTFAEGPYPVE
jgi:UDP-glucose 4-epimerase